MIFQKKIKPNTMIHIDGTVSTNRNSGKIGFIAITDGLSLTTIQVVYKIETIANFNNIKHILTGSSVSVFGTLINTKT